MARLCVRLVTLAALPWCGMPGALAQFGNPWGDPRFEAEYLALEHSGALAAPPAMVVQIEADLASIRAAYPEAAGIQVFPAWRPSAVNLDLSRAAFDQIVAGAFDGFDALFAELGVPDFQLKPDEPAFIPGAWVTFPAMYHGERLAERFAAIAGVTSAAADYTIGGGSDIAVLAGRSYLFTRGFGDCPAGCIPPLWQFRVTGGAQVELVASPEPATSVLAVVGLAAASHRVRRRLAKSLADRIRPLDTPALEDRHDETLHRPHRPGRPP